MHICLLTSGRILEVAYGGEERFTVSLGNWLIDHNQSVTLAGSSFMGTTIKQLNSRLNIGKKNDQMIRKPRSIYPPYFIYSLSRIVLVPLWILKILSLHKKNPIDVLHCQDTGYAGLAAILVSKILKIPVIISSHGIRHKTLESSLKGLSRIILSWLEYRLDIFSIKNADYFIAVSQSVKEYYGQVSPREIDIIPVPINLSDYEFSEESRRQIRKELRLEEQEIAIGFIGRLVPVKNLFLLLATFSDLLKNHPTLKLVLVGGGVIENDLRDFVISKSLERNVLFCGIRYDIGKVLSSIDIFVLPSFAEGLPTALIEAMACRRAVICSKIPAHKELIIHGKNGLLFDPHIPADLERAIILCFDETLRQELGHHAKQTAIIYDEKTVFFNILQYYEKIVNKQKP